MEYYECRYCMYAYQRTVQAKQQPVINKTTSWIGVQRRSIYIIHKYVFLYAYYTVNGKYAIISCIAPGNRRSRVDDQIREGTAVFYYFTINNAL